MGYAVCSRFRSRTFPSARAVDSLGLHQRCRDPRGAARARMRPHPTTACTRLRSGRSTAPSSHGGRRGRCLAAAGPHPGPAAGSPRGPARGPFRRHEESVPASCSLAVTVPRARAGSRRRGRRASGHAARRPWRPAPASVRRGRPPSTWPSSAATTSPGSPTTAGPRRSTSSPTPRTTRTAGWPPSTPARVLRDPGPFANAGRRRPCITPPRESLERVERETARGHRAETIMVPMTEVSVPSSTWLPIFG